MPTVRVSAMSTHCPGASSAAEVRNIAKNHSRKPGVRQARNISLAGTPAAARSVFGNRPDVSSRKMSAAAGNITTANL